MVFVCLCSVRKIECWNVGLPLPRSCESQLSRNLAITVIFRRFGEFKSSTSIPSKLWSFDKSFNTLEQIVIILDCYPPQDSLVVTRPGWTASRLAMSWGTSSHPEVMDHDLVLKPMVTGDPPWRKKPWPLPGQLCGTDAVWDWFGNAFLCMSLRCRIFWRPDNDPHESEGSQTPRNIMPGLWIIPGIQMTVILLP